MKIEGQENGLISKILNEQFKIIGEKMTFEEIPEDGIIEINGKKKYWYEHYKFKNMEQYLGWKKWAYEKLSILGKSNQDYVMMYLDMRYGMIVSYK